MTGWRALQDSSRKGTSFISEIDLSRGIRGLNLSSVSNSTKRGSFEEMHDELELAGEIPELLVSDEEVRGVEGDGSLLFGRKEGGLRGLGLFLRGKRRYSVAGGGFSSIRCMISSYTQSDPTSLEHGVQGRFASHLCTSPPNRNQHHGSVIEGGTTLTLFFLLIRRMRGSGGVGVLVSGCVFSSSQFGLGAYRHG